MGILRFDADTLPVYLTKFSNVHTGRIIGNKEVRVTLLTAFMWLLNVDCSNVCSEFFACESIRSGWICTQNGEETVINWSVRFTISGKDMGSAVEWPSGSLDNCSDSASSANRKWKRDSRWEERVSAQLYSSSARRRDVGGWR